MMQPEVRMNKFMQADALVIDINGHADRIATFPSQTMSNFRADGFFNSG